MLAGAARSFVQPKVRFKVGYFNNLQNWTGECPTLSPRPGGREAAEVHPGNKLRIPLGIFYS